jgi:hypothetical protein
MKNYYVYKVTFEEVPHFYFGMRKHSNPEVDQYMGSPVTNRIYWEIYTPKKQILTSCISFSSACNLEKALILQNWESKFCLNKNASGAIRPKHCSLGAKKTHRIILEKRKSSSEYDEKYRKQLGKKLNKTVLLKRELNLEYDKEYLKQRKKSLLIASKSALSEKSKSKRRKTLKLIEHQQGAKNSMYGTIWITNGTKEGSYRIKKNEAIPSGYRRGRVCK